MNCPKCGSGNVETVPETTTTTVDKTKGYGCCEGFCGYLLFGWIGLLCGLCGMGDGTTTTTHKTKMVHICQNCGNRF